MKKILQLLLFCLILFPARANEIDQFVYRGKQLKRQQCSDEVFLRRCFLTLTGRLPQAEKAKLFISSNDKKKRSHLIDELLGSDEYVRYMGMRWGDVLRIKSEFPSNLWPKIGRASCRERV